MRDFVRSTFGIASCLAVAMAFGLGPAADGLVAQEAEEAVEEEAESPAQGDATEEAIGVSGHWTIEVRNPDGTLDERVEFENHLASGRTISQMLLGELSPGYWVVVLHGGEQDICEGPQGARVPCEIWEEGSGQSAGHRSATLTSSLGGPDVESIVLSGSIQVDYDGFVVDVSTQPTACSGDTAPATCDDLEMGPLFTVKSLDSPVSVSAGQQVSVEVVIGFGTGQTLN